MDSALSHFGLPMPSAAELAGTELYGDGFSSDEIGIWFRNEEDGFFQLRQTVYKSADEGDFIYAAADTFHFYEHLGDRHFDTCLALGCADGRDIEALSDRVGKFIAIEPARKWWKDSIGGRPAEYRMPSLEGKLDVPDASVDLVTVFGVLHHIPNVSAVVGELARVMKPGAIMLVREPIVSMGDFTKPRVGLTAHERGIHWRVQTRMYADAGLRVKRRAFTRTNAVLGALKRFGIDSNTRFAVAVDALASRVLAFNQRYWRTRPHHKIGPAGITFILEKA